MLRYPSLHEPKENSRDLVRNGGARRHQTRLVEAGIYLGCVQDQPATAARINFKLERYRKFGRWPRLAHTF